MAKIISSLPGSAGVLSKTSQLINDGETGISTYVELNDLSTVATTGDYNNLINIPIDFTPKVHTHNISDISGTKSEFNTSLIDGNFLFVGDVSNTPDATTTSKGVIKLAGDLAGTADAPTVPGLANKVDKVAGKSLIADAEIARLATLYNYTHPANHPPSIITQDASNRFVTDVEKTAWNAKQGALGFTPENVANKNTANGYAGLGSDGKLISSQLPSITISDTFVTASQAAMLALTAETGDVAVRTDLNKSYILKENNPTVLASWQELLTPTSEVTSVNGRIGVVTAQTGDYTADQVTETATRKFQTDNQKLFNDATSSIQTQINGKQNNLVSGTSIKTLEGKSLLGSGNIDLVKADVGLSNVDNTSDANKPISTATQTALNGKENSFTKNTAFNKNFGTTAGTVVEGNDSRLSDSRTPTAGSNSYIQNQNSVAQSANMWINGIGKFENSNSTDQEIVSIKNNANTGVVTSAKLNFYNYNGTSVLNAAGIRATSNSWYYGQVQPNQLNIISYGNGGTSFHINNSSNYRFMSSASGDETTWVQLLGINGTTGAATFASTVTAPIFIGSLSGNASSASNATAFGGFPYGGVYSSGTLYYSTLFNSTTNEFQLADQSTTRTFLGLGSNAYTSTAFLPLSGGALSGIVTAPTFIGSLSGNASSASNATQWGGELYNGNFNGATPDVIMAKVSGEWRPTSIGAIQSFLGLGSNAYTSTAYLPLSGGTVSGTISASPATTANQVVVKSQLDAVAARPYKVYTALLSQLGTNAPTATVLENTLGGTVVWSRLSAGGYNGTLSAGVFTANKTVKFATLGYTGISVNSTIEVESTNTNVIGVITRVNGTQTDGVMSNGGTSIEIRVYN